jgi:hypothetical protein
VTALRAAWLVPAAALIWAIWWLNAAYFAPIERMHADMANTYARERQDEALLQQSVSLERAYAMLQRDIAPLSNDAPVSRSLAKVLAFLAAESSREHLAILGVSRAVASSPAAAVSTDPRLTGTGYLIRVSGNYASIMRMIEIIGRNGIPLEVDSFQLTGSAGDAKGGHLEADINVTLYRFNHKRNGGTAFAST